MTSQDIRISKQFCKFCLRVLKNEQISFYREIAKQRKTEKSLNELTLIAQGITEVKERFVNPLIISVQIFLNRLYLEKSED